MKSSISLEQFTGLSLYSIVYTLLHVSILSIYMCSIIYTCLYCLYICVVSSIHVYTVYIYTRHKKFSEGKQAHVGMEASKTNQT